MDQIFLFGPSFWAMAPNMPKMAQNTKIVTYPTVFELGSSSLRIMLTYPRAKNSWNRFFIQAPDFGLLLLRGSRAHSIVDCPSLGLTAKIGAKYWFYKRYLEQRFYSHLDKGNEPNIMRIGPLIRKLVFWGAHTIFEGLDIRFGCFVNAYVEFFNFCQIQNGRPSSF